MPQCNEEGCRVLTTGQCINGLDLDKCTHYLPDNGIKEFPTIEIPEEVQETTTRNIGVVNIYDGKALKLGDVNSVSRESITRLVILAGMPDSGKTTLLLSLLHLFATKPHFENYIFAGSRTLMDFEEKSHPSRIESNNKEEDTGRTPLGPPTFLHLKVTDTSSEETTDLLFTDISGEDFRTLKDNATETKKFVIGRRADHFVLFFDTKRITNINDRANAKANGIAILRSLIEANVLLPHTRIQVLFSRWDLKPTGATAANDDEFIDSIKNDITRQFGTDYEISFYETAARPDPGKADVVFGQGIDSIFPLWVKRSFSEKMISQSDKKNLITPKRQYLQYDFKG